MWKSFHRLGEIEEDDNKNSAVLLVIRSWSIEIMSSLLIACSWRLRDPKAGEGRCGCLHPFHFVKLKNN